MGRRTSDVRTTAQLKEAFLVDFGVSGNVYATCAKTKIGRTTAYEWRAADPAFAAGWLEAERQAVEVLEQEARRRAYTGVLETVYQGGKEVGQVRKYSDTLLIFLLNGAAPEKYKRQLVDTRVSGKLAVSGGDTLSAEEAAAIRRAYLGGGDGPSSGRTLPS